MISGGFAIKHLHRFGFVNFHAQPWRVPQLDMAIFDLPVVLDDAVAQCLIDLLLNQEVGYHGIDRHACGQRQRADGTVRHDVLVINLCVVGDLLQFCNTAAVGHVRLQKRNALLFDDAPELPSRQETFAGCDREGHMIGH